MKTIKIFLASSEEMENDRNAFGNLIRRLDKIYEQRGIRIRLFEWEDHDAAYNDRRKQDEYNEQIRDSDLFLALFHTRAGQFTVEEFDVATEEFRRHASPKIYTYFKELQPHEQETPELAAFKKKLFEELGHYWCRYNNRDTMQLHFVMQLQLVENRQMEELKVKNGHVTIAGMSVASMDRLPFAAGNEDYQHMNAELDGLPAKIEKARLRADKYPDDEDLLDELQQLLNRYNQLKEIFSRHQELLFNTAKRVAQLQASHITDRMRRAINAFNQGRVHDANLILDEAEHDASQVLQEYCQSRELTEQKRQRVAASINELLLKASTLLADTSCPAEERVKQASNLYAQADAMAQEIEYEKEKYGNLLFAYAEFLLEYACYDKALETYDRLLSFCKELYGTEHPDTITVYNNKGLIYSQQGNYEKALKYHSKALEIKLKVFGEDHAKTAMSYNNIGFIHFLRGNHEKASEYYRKALEIRLKTLGDRHPETAMSYNNIGGIYSEKGYNGKALTYFSKALEIQVEAFGEEHPETAASYNNIGTVYYKLGNLEKALEYYSRALEIQQKIFGEKHPNTANSYNNMGTVCSGQSRNEEALAYYTKALNIQLSLRGKEHPETATSYSNMAGIYFALEDYGKALEYCNRTLKIRIKAFGEKHPETAMTYNNMGGAYFMQKNYEKALEYYSKALEIQLSVLGEQHPDTGISYNSIGYVYAYQGNYGKALEYHNKALSILENFLAREHPTIRTITENIGWLQQQISHK